MSKEFEIHDFELNNIKPLNNYVIVKDAMDNRDEQGNVIMNSGLLISPIWDEARHVNVVMEVVKTPAKLNYKQWEDIRGGKYMEWDTDIQIESGDILWGDYLEKLLSYKFEVNGVVYYFIRYDSLFMAVRKGMDVMLNGYLLAERLYDKPSTILIVEEKPIPNTFKVLRKGLPNYSYRYDLFTDDDTVEENDIVLTYTDTPKELEYDIHLKKDGKKYHVFQRREVMAVLDSQTANY